MELWCFMMMTIPRFAFWPSPCCEQYHVSWAGWWMTQSGGPSCWLPCIYSKRQNMPHYMHCASTYHIQTVQSVRSEWMHNIMNELQNEWTQMDGWMISYLRRERTHWFSMKDLRSVQTSPVVSLSGLVLLLVFHLWRKTERERNRDIERFLT